MNPRPIAAGPVCLKPVTDVYRKDVLSIDVSPDQARFVATNAESLREARTDEEARPRAVIAGGRVVGFLMYSMAPDEPEAIVYRLMIDRRDQGKGYGMAAMRAVLGEIAALGHVRCVKICYDPENAAARRLYGKLGFAETGLDEDGEMIAELRLGADRTCGPR